MRRRRHGAARNNRAHYNGKSNCAKRSPAKSLASTRTLSQNAFEASDLAATVHVAFRTTLTHGWHDRLPSSRRLTSKLWSTPPSSVQSRVRLLMSRAPQSAEGDNHPRVDDPAKQFLITTMDIDMLLLLDLIVLLRNYMLTVLENYRVMLVTRVRIFLEWILQACMHPASVCSLRDIQEWFIIWKCYFANLLSFNNKEKDEKLLDWVRSRVDKLEVENFTSSWRSGVLLCALVDSIVPGSCPRYDLLNEDNRLGNAQLAVQLLEKLNIKSCLTAQELADDDADIEKPVKALLTQLRMTAAKRRLRNAVKSPFDDACLSQSSEFFAKGMGLIFAVKGRKASFNIFRRGQRAFSFVIEIQGPDGTLGSALITHKSIRNQTSNSKLKRQLSSESTKIVIDYSLTDEMISVFYTPVTSGKHTLNIVSQGQHILRSPYDISVDCNTTEVTARVVETLFRPKKSALQKLGRRFSGTSLLASKLQETEVAVPFPNVEATGKVIARRVIKRTILNGDHSIVVPGDDESSLVKALRDISNLNPENRERLRQKQRSFLLRPVSELRNPHMNKLRYQMIRTVSEEKSSIEDDSPEQQQIDVCAEASESATPLRNVPQKPRRLSLETVEEDNPCSVDERRRSGDENNNRQYDVVHDHEFLISKRNVTLNIVNENPYVPKTSHMLQTYRQSSSHDGTSEQTANDRRLLYQMESKSQRLRSSWDFLPDKIRNDSRRTLSREGHFGSSDEGDDRMSEIDGQAKDLPVASVLEKFTRFSPTASPDCSTSGSSNGSEASGPRTTFVSSYRSILSSQAVTPPSPSDLEDAFFDDDIFQQELLQDTFPPFSDSFRLCIDDNLRVSSPQCCVVSGNNALYCGKTFRLMSFEVRTLLAAAAGEGVLSVTVQSSQPDAVLETRVVLVDCGLYRVNYRVKSDGYYVIVVKWGDWHVPGSPFLCHVTSR